jgi:hypothetical protein
MKKSLFSAMIGLALILFATSCSKDDPAAPTPTPQGTWAGTAQYGTGGGNPTYVFSLNLKANGTVDIVGNNSVAIDNATGTWQLVQDSVKATYTYTASSAVYNLSAKYSASSNTMTGTIGLSPAISGVGIFTVTRQ